MRLAELEHKCRRRLPLSRNLWAMAALLGEARRLSNEYRRAAHRDRGDRRNQHADLLGALVELLLFVEVIRLNPNESAIGYMREHLFNPEGGAKEIQPDLRFDDPATDRSICVDAKSFDCAPYKRYFAINREKHAKLKGACDYYYCVLVPAYGQSAVVSALVPYTDVDAWAVDSLGSYEDPSRNLPIRTFLTRYCAASLSDLHSLNTWRENEIIERSRTQRLRNRLVNQIPALKDRLPSS